MCWLEADESHDAHMHDWREVVEDGDDGENEQLIASVGANHRQCLVQLHQQPTRQICHEIYQSTIPTLVHHKP